MCSTFGIVTSTTQLTALTILHRKLKVSNSHRIGGARARGTSGGVRGHEGIVGRRSRGGSRQPGADSLGDESRGHSIERQKEKQK